jgi:hypothetical protein
MEHWWRNMRLTLPTPLMPLTRHMLQADTKKRVAGITTQVEFDASIQSLRVRPETLGRIAEFSEHEAD